jgi:hypothetical protein
LDRVGRFSKALGVGSLRGSFEYHHKTLSYHQFVCSFMVQKPLNARPLGSSYIPAKMAYKGAGTRFFWFWNGPPFETTILNTYCIRKFDILCICNGHWASANLAYTRVHDRSLQVVQTISWTVSITGQFSADLFTFAGAQKMFIKMFSQMRTMRWYIWRQVFI